MKILQTLLLCIVAIRSTVVLADANLVANGDFEVRSTKGTADRWICRGAKGMWKLLQGNGVNGSLALEWECNDANAQRSYAAQQITLSPGEIYSLEVDILIEGSLKGPYGKGAGVHFEQFDANGKWLSGTYTEEIKTTQGQWRRMSAVSAPIKQNAVRFIARLQVTKGCTGKVRFDNFRIAKLKLGNGQDPSVVPYRYAPERANTNRCVWIDGMRRTRVNGEPFFPLGVYGGILEKDIGRFKGGPFNTIMAYGAPDRKALDRAAANGVKVISGVNHVCVKAKERPKGVDSPADERAWLERYVGEVKDHPALLAWYAADEIPVTRLPELVARRDLLEELDPEHPVWCVYNNTALMRHYVPSFDIAGADPYPVQEGSDIAGSSRWTRETVQGSGGNRAAWLVPQIFSWSHYNRKGGVPTREEIRNQTWQCIAEGATGIIYFKYGDLLNNSDTGRTFEDRWADVTNVAWEVRRAFPLLLSSDPAPAVSGTNDTLCARAFAKNGQIHLLVVNASRKRVDAKIEVQKIGYPAYEAVLEPLEVRFVNLTDLRPTIPQHRIGRDAWYAPKGWWERRHREKLAEIAAGPKEYDMVFVGDSITHNWEGWKNADEAKFIDALHDNGKGRLKNGSRPAADSWDAMAAKYRVLNLGYGGDCTQHVLWRIANGEMDGYKAKNVMLMIGTNNSERPDAVVDGIRAVVDAIRSKHPEARILLSAIFPRQASSQHKQRKRNGYINSKIRELADGKRVVWLDFNSRFLRPDGTLTRGTFPDLLHPAAEGYRIWLDEIKPFLEGTVREADIRGPEAWLEFMGGNVRKDGLRADLEAIKAAGLKGVHFFHISRAGVWPDCPEQIPCMSEKWGDVVSFLGDECRRLGLRLVVQNCPGWSQSGGPWIAVTNAMREAVFSRTDFAVGDTVRLPEIPKKYADANSDWRDIAVLAFPLPEGDGTGELLPASSKRDGDAETYEFASPVTVRTITLPSPKLYNNNYTYHAPWLGVRLEAFDADGKAHTVLDTPLPTSSWRDYVLPLTLACDEFTAKKWRFTLRHKYPVQRFKGPKFFSEARHTDWEMKSGLVLRSLLYEKPPKQSSSAWVDGAKILDITHLRKPDGTFDWKVPEGRWTLLRVAHVNSKRVNSPAPKEATGWECDKLAPEGAEANFNGYVGMLADGPLKGRLDGMLVDSWECFGQTWTPRMEQYFREANGYEIRKWLPVLFGWVVSNPSETERVLTDWRRTIGDLITKNYYGHMAKLAHERGMGILYETAFGDIISGDILEYWKYSDAPMCEYWLPHRSKQEGHVGCYAYKPIRPCASAAHIYGKRRVTAEAFTGWGISWKEDFKELRDVANRHFAKGVTHLALQSYTHAPAVDATPPGGCMGGFNGTPFTRLQTWWRHMPEFTAWLTKCEELLEEGVPSNDVLWYLGDAVGHKPDEYYAFPEGYSVDYLNHDVLTNRLSVKNGMFTIPEGTVWKVLWVPDEHFMLPATRKRLAELTKAGGKVVFGGKDRLTKALASIGKDVTTAPEQGDGLNEDFMWLHRKVGAMDRYFVAAGTNGWTGKVSFRANGAASVYDPVSGERYAWRNGGALELHPSQSVFVEFGGEAASKRRNQKREVACKFAPWRISFPKGWGAPESVTLDMPRSWTEIPEFTAEAKAYSGTVVYETEFDFGEIVEGEMCILDLGRVETIAKVYLNGREVRTLWCEPYSCDVTGFVKKGRNSLKVEVTNTWRNRVVYDLNQPEKDRKTWILYQKNFNPPLDSPLIPSGILCPVKFFLK